MSDSPLLQILFAGLSGAISGAVLLGICTVFIIIKKYKDDRVLPDFSHKLRIKRFSASDQNVPMKFYKFYIFVRLPLLIILSILTFAPYFDFSVINLFTLATIVEIIVSIVALIGLIKKTYWGFIANRCFLIIEFIMAFINLVVGISSLSEPIIAADCIGRCIGALLVNIPIFFYFEKRKYLFAGIVEEPSSCNIMSKDDTTKQHQEQSACDHVEYTDVHSSWSKIIIVLVTVLAVVAFAFAFCFIKVFPKNTVPFKEGEKLTRIATIDSKVFVCPGPSFTSGDPVAELNVDDYSSLTYLGKCKKDANKKNSSYLWYKVSFRNKTGWVRSDFVEVRSSAHDKLISVQKKNDDDIQQLTNENQGLYDKINQLRDENQELRSQNRQLTDRIKELRSKVNNPKAQNQSSNNTNQSKCAEYGCYNTLDDPLSAYCAIHRCIVPGCHAQRTSGITNYCLDHELYEVLNER